MGNFFDKDYDPYDHTRRLKAFQYQYKAHCPNPTERHDKVDLYIALDVYNSFKNRRYDTMTGCSGYRMDE